MATQQAAQPAEAKLSYLFEEAMCGQLSLSRSAAYEFLRAGSIDTYMVGRRRYVTHEALIAFRSRLMREQNGGAA